MAVHMNRKLAAFVIGAMFLCGIAFTKSASAATTVLRDDVVVEKMGDASISAKPERVQYELPYPGMLPDNPLYFLKMIRDGIVKALINDPFKRAEFSLLNAQKRMYAAKFLSEKGKGNLTRETISKSNNYLQEAIVSIQTVRKNNPKNTNVKPFLDQALTVGLKHKEMLVGIRKNLGEKFHNDIAIEEKRLDSNIQTIQKLLLAH